MKFMEIKNVVNVYETPASKIRKYLCLKRERERERERKREYVKDGYVEFVSPRISFEGKGILLKNQPLNFQKSFHLHISTFFP